MKRTCEGHYNQTIRNLCIFYQRSRTKLYHYNLKITREKRQWKSLWYGFKLKAWYHLMEVIVNPKYSGFKPEGLNMVILIYIQQEWLIDIVTFPSLQEIIDITKDTWSRMIRFWVLKTRISVSDTHLVCTIISTLLLTIKKWLTFAQIKPINILRIICQFVFKPENFFVPQLFFFSGHWAKASKPDTVM